MYDKLFRAKDVKLINKPVNSYFDKKAIKKIRMLNWEGHCNECAVPICYTTCLLYKKREDLKCERIENGLVRNKNYHGYFNYGIECKFNTWGRLETEVSNINTPVWFNKWWTSVDYTYSSLLYYTSKLFKPFSPKFKLLRAFTLYKKRFYLKYQSLKPPQSDYFLIECYSKENKNIQLWIQCYTSKKILFSEFIILQPGHNYKLIPYSKFNISNNYDIRLSVGPAEEGINPTIIFTWLDFVLANDKDHLIKTSDKPAEKVKCVAWDLDNTLWKGTLIEDGADNLVLNENAVKVIKALDERGILNTVVSKNNHKEALQVLEKFNIKDYFIYPAINWGQKSENLKEVAKLINIGLDTVVMVDDSVRELNEVETNLNMVRTYSDKQIDILLNLPEFDVPVTEMSKKRRLSYLTEMKREEIKAHYKDDYNEFIKSLNLSIKFNKVEEDNVVERCYELLARSNQLNLSANKYTREEYMQLLSDKNTVSYAINSEDKFGQYGIVGFISANVDGLSAKINNLVISCRIAKKRVEQAIIYNTVQLLKQKNVSEVTAVLKKTNKNGPIAEIFDNMPFKIESSDDGHVVYKLNDLSLLKDEGLIRLEHE